MDSWDQLSQIDNYTEVAGTILFQKLFHDVPDVKALFGFPLTMDPQSDTMAKSRRFLQHASYMIEMFTKALNLLGPDTGLLQETLKDLGQRHARFGVKAEFVPHMGNALIAMLRDILGPKFTPDVKEAWQEVYKALSKAMIKAMSSEQAVLDSWAKLKMIRHYDEKAGVLLFQHLFRKCPQAKGLFGFPVTIDVESESLLESRRFTMHAKYFIEMLDKTFAMVEADSIEENMKELGAMHAMYGVKAEYFPVMGEGLFYALEKMLPKGEWDEKLQSAWADLYSRLSSQMIAAMNNEHAVLESWAKLKRIEDYDEKVGVLLFQQFFLKCPKAKTLFGFPIDMDVESETMLHSRRFTMHAKYFVEMLDRALSLVEAKKMDESIKQLGEMHATYGVKPEFFPVMGEALFLSLEQTLPKGDWNTELRAAWGKLFSRLSSKMINAMENSTKKEENSTKKEENFKKEEKGRFNDTRSFYT